MFRCRRKQMKNKARIIHLSVWSPRQRSHDVLARTNFDTPSQLCSSCACHLDRLSLGALLMPMGSFCDPSRPPPFPLWCLPAGVFPPDLLTHRHDPAHPTRLWVAPVGRGARPFLFELFFCRTRQTKLAKTIRRCNSAPDDYHAG